VVVVVALVKDIRAGFGLLSFFLTLFIFIFLYSRSLSLSDSVSFNLDLFCI
jgi:hypothetical protein